MIAATGIQSRRHRRLRQLLYLIRPTKAAQRRVAACYRTPLLFGSYLRASSGTAKGGAGGWYCADGASGEKRVGSGTLGWAPSRIARKSWIKKLNLLRIAHV